MLHARVNGYMRLRCSVTKPRGNLVDAKYLKAEFYERRHFGISLLMVDEQRRSGLEDESEFGILGLIAERAPAILNTAVPGTTFWTGAGISRDLPTGGPVGNELADRAFGHAFAVDTLNIVLSYYKALQVSRSRPRLETILDVVHRVHGFPVLIDLLSDLQAPQPNGMHYFFAAHIRAGGRHITANFDPGIECAAAADGQEAAVLHFHGSLAITMRADNLAQHWRLSSEVCQLISAIGWLTSSLRQRCWCLLATADQISSTLIPFSSASPRRLGCGGPASCG